MCVLYLYVLDQHGDVGEVSNLGRSLQNLRDHVAPLGIDQQRVLENVSQPWLWLWTQPRRSAFHTATWAHKTFSSKEFQRYIISKQTYKAAITTWYIFIPTTTLNVHDIRLQFIVVNCKLKLYSIWCCVMQCGGLVPKTNFPHGTIKYTLPYLILKAYDNSYILFYNYKLLFKACDNPPSVVVVGTDLEISQKPKLVQVQEPHTVKERALRLRFNFWLWCRRWIICVIACLAQ